ncbi:FMN reductase [Bacillus subtilis]|uniref:FMN reductase n=1 Tax=Pseudochrobactrum asaccharolyticum TaxID=354351 RepID=UPI001F01C400|nr:FMN reductase [Pseudochrobactrum asaccharolyticum]MCF7644125.1 FMN reductase [Pseudochrobactrum asaccharolyticum]MCF7670636.1 FMN reductase [Bacillus subtilis]
MNAPRITGFSGNLTSPSKTRGFVEHIAGQAALSLGGVLSVYDIADLGASFPAARWPLQLDKQASDIVDEIAAADLLVVGTPTYKGSYTGLFKHFFDLLDPKLLRGKPVILAATGGGDRHSLIVEHQLRPLFGFFEAFALPTAIYVSDRDFTDGQLSNVLIENRIAQAVSEAVRVVSGHSYQQLAAE